MAANPNNGAFWIPAEDKTDKNSFSIPGDLAGESPEGTDNPVQPSYHLDEDRTDIAKQYYVHIWNGWDVSVEAKVRGSRYNDESMTEAVDDVEQELIPSQSGHGWDQDSGHSHIDVFIRELSDIPSTGKLKVTIQHRYR